MHPIKSSIKRLLLALGLSQKTIAHLGFAYARGKRNVRIGLFVAQRACRQILIGGGNQLRIQLCAINHRFCAVGLLIIA